MKLYTVSQINRYIKNFLENDSFLGNIAVEAEISNFKLHTSGHIYFTLKDERSALNCVMFAGNAASLTFMPESGMKVTARGHISLYEKTGQYQLYVSAMEPAGIGELYMAYEKLKERLEKAGLFDAEYKKPIPDMPGTVAVITSPTGAAVRDIINVSGRRNPNVELVIVPVLVQGENAAADIASAIERVNRWGGADTIIVGRGGGSIEDLWAFNEEIVAKAIFFSEIPVISAVGHETDFTIADFVADMRAPTPSAAAELAVPEGNELSSRVSLLLRRISDRLRSILREDKMRLDRALSSYMLRNMQDMLFENEDYVSELYMRLSRHISNYMEGCALTYKNCLDNIENRSPLNILKRGYSLTTDKGGRIIKSVKNVNVNDEIAIRLSDGSISAVVKGEEDIFGKEEKL